MKSNTAKKIDPSYQILSPVYAENTNPALYSDLYQEVLLTLKNQWEFPGDRITIAENNGWITLSGEVPWYFQRKAANAAIQLLPAVEGVIDNLYVISQEKDDEDKVLLEAAFFNSTELRNKDIRVTVTDHEITLNGKVQSRDEKKEAERISWMIPGIWIVDNDIIIEA